MDVRQSAYPTRCSIVAFGRSTIGRPATRAAARATERSRRHRRGQDGRLRPRGDRCQARVGPRCKAQEADRGLPSARRARPEMRARKPVDVMGYHDGSDLPNYWAYAHRYVLQDHMFEPNYGWSLPAHLFQLSAWSAKCARPSDPATCRNDLLGPARRACVAAKAVSERPAVRLDRPDLPPPSQRRELGLLPLVPGKAARLRRRGDIACKPGALRRGTPSSWNPLPSFTTVRRDGQLRNIQPVSQFVRAAKTVTLPAVTWIVPRFQTQRAPADRSSATGRRGSPILVNTVMRGPEWKSTAVFIAWDDWGGFYDHVVPPKVDRNGYGFRVPGARPQPVRQARLCRPPDAVLRRLSPSSSKTTFSAGRGSILRRTDGPTLAPPCARPSRSSGISRNDFDFTRLPERYTAAGPSSRSVRPPARRRRSPFNLKATKISLMPRERAMIPT